MFDLPSRIVSTIARLRPSAETVQLSRLRRTLIALSQEPELNFLLTNRIPRRWATQFMGWFSRIEQPQVRDLSLLMWRLFAELEMEEAKETVFRSMHEVFIRELRPGARTIDPRPGVVVSPCDGLVGEHGTIAGTELIQAKGFPYTLQDLLHDPELVSYYRDGSYVTLRLTSSMYHRFHAPTSGCLEHVTYISGDTWNTNPIALQRVERLFCKNERAVLQIRLEPDGPLLTLVPVAAILIASIRLHALNTTFRLSHRGPNEFPCAVSLQKGEELGYFQHGSTILVFAPQGFSIAATVRHNQVIRMGQPLLVYPPPRGGGFVE